MGLNIVGLQRRGFLPEQIQTISEVYHILFIQNHSFSKAVELIEKKLPDSILKKEILQFVEQSKNGIIKRYSKNEIFDED
jgi:UDP-N-acetylglucosamine acyltransferase